MFQPAVKTVKPNAKDALSKLDKHAVRRGIQVAGDILQGQNVGETFKQQGQKVGQGFRASTATSR